MNTQSSTETELRRADMYMPEMLWSIYFMQSQGCDVEIVELYPDNKSTQLLMENGRFSSRKKTNRIKMKFSFIKDGVDDGDVRIVHCPMELIWVEVLSVDKAIARESY